jgi:hypothetical protein
MENKLESYRQKYKKKTFIKTVFGENNCKRRCIIFVEEICSNSNPEFCNYIVAKGWGVNAANEFRYAEFGLDGNEVCAATQQEIDFWKKQRVKAFFNNEVNIRAKLC